MGVISIKHRGNFKITERFLNKASRTDVLTLLRAYGDEGVRALSDSTPIDSGETARSWGYEIHINPGSVGISWTNVHVNKGQLIAILIQYGHGTGTGGYVQGIDYINPAMRPVFEKISDSIWKEVVQ